MYTTFTMSYGQRCSLWVRAAVDAFTVSSGYAAVPPDSVACEPAPASPPRPNAPFAKRSSTGESHSMALNKLALLGLASIANRFIADAAGLGGTTFRRREKVFSFSLRRVSLRLDGADCSTTEAAALSCLSLPPVPPAPPSSPSSSSSVISSTSVVWSPDT